MIKPKMIAVYGMQLYKGIILTYYSGVLVLDTMKQRHTPTDNHVDKARLGATLLIFFGIMEVVGAMGSGRLIKALGKRYGIYLLTVIGIATCLGILALTYKKVEFGWEYYVQASLWGLADATLSTSLIGLLVIFYLIIGIRI